VELRERDSDLLKPDYRPLVHASSILIPVLVELTSKPLILAGLCLVSVLYVAEEFLRLRGIHVPLISEFTLKMSRHCEADHFIAAPIILAFGIILVLLFFPRNIAYASIAIVAVGDPIAAYVGRRFGRRFVGRKTWEGFAAGTTAAFLPTLLVVQPIVGAVGSIAGMMLELSGIPDDNLTITLTSAMAMYLVTALVLPH
jgi:dolichol kinase